MLFGLPQHILIDNGKDYRCKDFAGGRVSRVKVVVDEKGSQAGAIAQLGIQPHFSKPYGAQTKPIERDFNTVKNTLSKHMPGYRGGDVVERPESLEHEIKSGQIMKFDEFSKLLDIWVAEVFNSMPSEGKDHKGLSRIQAWNKEQPVLRKITPEAMRLFCMRISNVYAIGRNGVRDGRIDGWYWGDWMSGSKGEKVYLRRDLKAWQLAYVYRAENDEYLGDAFLATAAHGLAETDVDRQLVRDLERAKAQDKKLMKAYLDNLDRPDMFTRVANMAAGYQSVAAKNGPTELAEQKVFTIDHTAMDAVIEARSKMAKTGTDDIGALIVERPKKKKLFSSPEEKADYENLMAKRQKI